ncbi:hypothetical protein ZWY2020_035858 [Hordeum vulgare]|nr:hypothetical protein ZWY2020_035858 [Hordeum vulgare]
MRGEAAAKAWRRWHCERAAAASMKRRWHQLVREARGERPTAAARAWERFQLGVAQADLISTVEVLKTRSGKTHTMLDEISELGVKPDSECGMAPRIFQFLIARIRAEEESRRDENLKYNCKCSFLEIYNEQITDLLDSSSTKLQLREDTRVGVYVENLTKREVTCVSDIITLLMQGSVNRKVYMIHWNLFTFLVSSTT